ncbi:CRISPR-associated protein Cas4 [Hydrogenobaculum sp. SHO]|jgi:CRISPR-associated exonuclease, Cas4 family|nr:CRISPR-associated protein Cas4 [Hydrogenobaculum sp. SHO]
MNDIDAMSFDYEGLKIFRLNGTKVNYYIICKRKLWLFHRGLTMENGYNKVKLGQILQRLVNNFVSHNKISC